jgi:hypothetical protein
LPAGVKAPQQITASAKTPAVRIVTDLHIFEKSRAAAIPATSRPASLMMAEMRQI